MSYTTVGRPLGRIEGPAKVTGEAVYTADVRLPDAVWGKVLRSALPHARIVRIETQEAERLPGVLAVLTAKDLPDVLIGRRVYDMPVLARDRVRFIGEKVAVVAAEQPDVAEEALARIEVEYEELPAVFETEEAMKAGAPLLHPQYRSYPYAPAKYFSDLPNVHSHVTWQVGDVTQGFAQATHVFEHTFTTHHVHQGYIEPHASAVALESDGRVHVWTSNKMPFRTRELLADAVQVPPERIVVHLLPIGGDFGGKGSLTDTPLCYHLAERVGRPVKMVMSYTEELMAGNPRHPTTVHLRTGVTHDGRMVAREARVIFNSGAYAAFKPTPVVNITGANQAAGAYGIPHVRIDAFSVYTNCVPAGHMRAHGDPQVSFGVEAATDMIAEALGMDPLEFRRRNLLKDGDQLPTGHPLEHVRVRETLDAAALAHERSLRVQKLYRVAYSPHVTAFSAQVVELEVDPDTGQITLLDVVTAHDVGTIINPLTHQGQIEGGLIQGIGFGMLEELRSEEGRIATLSLGDYKLPNIKDNPPLKTVLVQEPVGPVPFQGKSIGENSITPITAAIVNALYDAVGVRISNLPTTAEKVYERLQQQQMGDETAAH